MMKEKIKRLLQYCAEAETILLTGPVFPDGDSIGACLALKELLKARCRCQVTLMGKITFHYQWMNNIESFFPDQNLEESYDVAIVLDGDRTRLTPAVQNSFDASKISILIDHHRSTDPSLYDLALLNPEASSTCEMIYAIMEVWDIPLNRSIAEAIYTGLIFDTGGFLHSNTTPSVLRLAARLLETGISHNQITTSVLRERQDSGLSLLQHCLSQRKRLEEGKAQYAFISRETFTQYGCSQGDIEGLVDHLLYVQGVELACLGYEQADGRVKISLRSRRHVNVAALARKIHSGGGGHVRAAGAMLPYTLSEAQRRIPQYLEDALREDGAL